MRKVVLISLMFCYLTFVKANNPGYLGVLIHDVTNKSTVGVQVVNVFDDGAAKQYGVKENDIITAINGVKVLKREDLTAQLARYNWADKVHLDFVRNGVPSNVDVYLGYKGTTRTYNVKKNIKNDGEHWLFTDDNTDVLVNDKLEPISISKVNDKGLIDVWQPSTNYKDAEVPQYFLDLDDKIYCIKRIKEEQAKRNSTLKDIIFIKEVKQDKNEEPTTKLELLPEIFSIAPNPSNGQFSVNIKTNEKSSAIQLMIFDVTGRVVKTETIENSNGEVSKQFNLENEPKGAYLIQLKINDKITTKKIILQ